MQTARQKPRVTRRGYMALRDGIIDTDLGEQCDLGALNALGTYCTPYCTIGSY
jgi:hypothetical protein